MATNDWPAELPLPSTPIPFNSQTGLIRTEMEAANIRLIRRYTHRPTQYQLRFGMTTRQLLVASAFLQKQDVNWFNIFLPNSKGDLYEPFSKVPVRAISNLAIQSAGFDYYSVSFLVEMDQSLQSDTGGLVDFPNQVVIDRTGLEGDTVKIVFQLKTTDTMVDWIIGGRPGSPSNQNTYIAGGPSNPSPDWIIAAFRNNAVPTGELEAFIEHSGSQTGTTVIYDKPWLIRGAPGDYEFLLQAAGGQLTSGPPLNQWIPLSNGFRMEMLLANGPGNRIFTGKLLVRKKSTQTIISNTDLSFRITLAQTGVPQPLLPLTVTGIQRGPFPTASVNVNLLHKDSAADPSWEGGVELTWSTETGSTVDRSRRWQNAAGDIDGVRVTKVSEPTAPVATYIQASRPEIFSQITGLNTGRIDIFIRPFGAVVPAAAETYVFDFDFYSGQTLVYNTRMTLVADFTKTTGGGIS